MYSKDIVQNGQDRGVIEKTERNGGTGVRSTLFPTIQHTGTFHFVGPIRSTGESDVSNNQYHTRGKRIEIPKELI